MRQILYSTAIKIIRAVIQNRTKEQITRQDVTWKLAKHANEIQTANKQKFPLRNSVPSQFSAGQICSHPPPKQKERSDALEATLVITPLPSPSNHVNRAHGFDSSILSLCPSADLIVNKAVFLKCSYCNFGFNNLILSNLLK